MILFFRYVNYFTYHNLLKLNYAKCHLTAFGDKNTEITIKIGNLEIEESDCEKLLGIAFDRKLNFKKHTEDICRKANQKIHALARLSNYIDPVKSEILLLPPSMDSQR